MRVLALDRIDTGLSDLTGLVGGKAAGLAEAIRAGERVPAGFCVTTEAHRSGEVPREEVAAAYEALGGGRVAVRSSATAEDLPDASFAGQQDTYLNVEGVDELVAAVRRCWDSLGSDRARAYRRDRGIDDASVHMAVVVQRMVDPRAAGVLFTANPVTGTRGETVLDAVPGLGTAVVDGTADPDHYVVRPDGGTEGPGGGCLAPDEVAALRALGERLQARFGSPQDVEWAVDRDGTLWVLQSRAITTLFPLPPSRADGPGLYLEGGHMQGMLRPFTPLGFAALTEASRDWFSSLSGKGASGLDAWLVNAGGRLYLDLTALVRNPRTRAMVPGALGIYGPGAVRALQHLLDDPRFAPRPGRSVRAEVVLRGARALAPVLAKVAAGAALALWDPARTRERMFALGERARAGTRRTPERVVAARDRVEHARHLQAPVLSELMLPMLGPLYAGLTAAKLPEYLLSGVAEPSEVAAVLGGMPHNVTTTMDLELWRVAERAGEHRELLTRTPPRELAERYLSGDLPDIGLTGFLTRYGHRGAAEIDAGVPRWAEDPAPVFSAIANYLRVSGPEQSPERRFAAAAERAVRTRDELVRRLAATSPVRARLTAFLLDRARELSGLREYPKFVWLYALAQVRRQMLLVGAELAGQGRIDRADDVVFLDFDEVHDLLDGADLRGLVAERRAEYRRELGRRRVPQLLLSDGTDLTAALPPLSGGEGPEGALTGVAASPGTATGVARVVRDPAGAVLAPGEILVAPTTDPGWTPLFMTAGGLVVETGSIVAHGPTVAREYGIPCVICVPGVTDLVRDGQTITIDGSSGTIRVEEPGESEGPGTAEG
ncbi:PEP/pyruvate-binding domain-containing protein [Nocardiopsis metallicus]|uniref:Pyruvate,water dikinase n=1 Tax=Nocardiopsis metallicus TaxID=179819 RepID=A0A840W8N7_9ACTN|nr:PEP/pyruvate-binding domain-containing protein [Nocardiopsis metallicus]MBB5493379.1 pyruvate,water dikinase [Nocardiopsis metallicus]